MADTNADINYVPWRMAVEKRLHNGGMRIEVGVTVMGLHSFQSLNSESLKPPMIETLVFPHSNIARPVNVLAGNRGTISLLVRLVYKFLPSGALMAGAPPVSYGSKAYRYSFEYEIPLAATSPTALIIHPPPAVAVMDGDPVVEGDDDNTVEISAWNPDIGEATGPNYVRIQPSIALPQTSSSVSLSGGLTVGGTGAGYQRTTSTTPPLPVSSIGAFKIPIHTLLLPLPPVPASGPPADFVKDMAVGWTYAKDKDSVLTPDMRNSLTRWMGNINAKYLQTVSKAVQKGELTVWVGGYASAVGTPADNQELSTSRVNPVVDYISRHLVPKGKILAVPYGPQFSQPYWEFDTKGSAKMVSRPEDRKVIVSIDPTEAWRVK